MPVGRRPKKTPYVPIDFDASALASATIKDLVIVEKAEKSDILDIDKKKWKLFLTSNVVWCWYLVLADLTIGQFVYVIRKRIKLSSEKAIFIFVKNVLPPTTTMMSSIYEEHKDEDGFFYFTYSGENTFGDLYVC
ncbi:unnamed protein product [Sphagnum troendelagicum]